MYDPRSEPHEFVGEGRDQAIEKACQFFGVQEAELSIFELATAEVFGAAGRAVVVAMPREQRARAPRGESSGGDRRPAEPRRERGRREGRGRRERSAREPEPRSESRPGPRESRPEPRESRPEPEGPSVGTPVGELGDIGDFVRGVVERMGLGPFEISESREGGVVVCALRGPAARLLAGADARAAEAIQLLANQAAMRAEGEPERIVVDVEGNQEARDELLTRLAQRVAGRARDSGRPVALDPMNGRDRRAIHLALRDEEGVATMSVGEGRYRQVVVVPEGDSDYEEARRQSEAAASQQDEG